MLEKNSQVYVFYPMPVGYANYFGIAKRQISSAHTANFVPQWFLHWPALPNYLPSSSVRETHPYLVKNFTDFQFIVRL